MRHRKLCTWEEYLHHREIYEQARIRFLRNYKGRRTRSALNQAATLDAELEGLRITAQNYSVLYFEGIDIR